MNSINVVYPKVMTFEFLGTVILFLSKNAINIPSNFLKWSGHGTRLKYVFILEGVTTLSPGAFPLFGV